ncbi:MAG: hypothetical protein ACFCGT_22555 [Sandaracinaceae bacterium]
MRRTTVLMPLGLLVAASACSSGSAIGSFMSGQDPSAPVRQIDGSVAYCAAYQDHLDAELDDDERYDWFCRREVVTDALARDLSRDECEANLAACPGEFAVPSVRVADCPGFSAFFRQCQAQIGALETCLSDRGEAEQTYRRDLDCDLLEVTGPARDALLVVIAAGAPEPDSCTGPFNGLDCLRILDALDFLITATPR